MPSKMLLFAPAAYNLAETTRAVEIAKACEHHFEICFCSYGGEFEHIIMEAGYSIRLLEPQLTPEKIDYLYKLDQGEAFGLSFFSKEEVQEQVKNEIALLEELRPAAVITGFVFSCNISCRVVGVPLIWLTHTTWNFPSVLEQGLMSHPDMVDFPPLNWFSEELLIKITRKLLPCLMGMFLFYFRPFRQVAKQYNVPTSAFDSLQQVWEGDYNLLAEPKEFCPLDLPPSYHFIGPLIGRLDAPIPEEILNIPHDKPIVYFAMGSSGQPQVIADIVEGFADKPIRVIAPVKALLAGRPVTIPDNVFVTDWLPAHKVNPIADISVIHGGIGTTMTACLAGKPVVGIAMQMEQEANVDRLVQLGFAIRIRKKDVSPERLYAAIEQLLVDGNAKAKALEFQKVVKKWEDSSLITKFFVDTFLKDDTTKD